ncbi:MAG: hypothetical protein CMN17_00590 [Roseovarius sp.]|nr:hypothetical protein [Roseovarius sp.]MBK44100.1 hypothetical protein [Roseovarius sp.]|tara:strand:- start:2527 stop:3207 length:681 start_codon:yes stop_codon:yes gene_type:complete
MIKSFAVATVLTVSAAAASASGVILDTLNKNGMPANLSTNPLGISFFNLISSSSNTEPFGQSFMLDEATESLSVDAYFSSLDFPQPTSVSVTASLVTGAGVDGSELGMALFEATEVTRNDALLATFDFSNLGALDAGTYTITFEGVGALGGGDIFFDADGNRTGTVTAGTQAFDANGPFNFGSNPAREFGIRVSGDAVTPVPLPAGLPLLLAGLGGLAILRRKHTV